MTTLLLALGLVLVVEGLAIALAPSRLEDVVALLARMGRDQRRGIGLAALSIGIALIWLAGGLP